MITISAVVTVGRDDSMGYQYNFYAILQHLSKIFDKVIIVSSTRKKFKLNECENIILISDERSWFPLTENGETFQFGKLFDNTMLGLREASKHTKAALLLSINQYLPKKQKTKIYKSAEYLINSNKPWAWVHKSYQILDKITYPSNRVPYLINLGMLDQVTMAPDSIIYKGRKTPIEDGLFIKPPFFIVDIMGDTSKEDLELKWDYYESKLFAYTYGTTRERPSWEERVNYLQLKLANKIYWQDAEVPEAKFFSDRLPTCVAAHRLIVQELPKINILYKYFKSSIKILRNRIFDT